MNLNKDNYPVNLNSTKTTNWLAGYNKENFI